jgi:diacylglycerol kinase family enzyme
LRVTLIINAASGRGRAVKVAERIDSLLRARGHHTDRVSVQDSAPVRETLADADVAVVVGGDGTLHAILEDCVATQTPAYHAPAGTENLFAREFAMSHDPETVLRAVEDGRNPPIDVCRANGRPFVLMASIGWDASIIHYLHKNRNGAIRHITYVKPILIQLARFPRVWFDVQAEGRSLVSGHQGLLVVANSRRYAMRLDPARDARPDDALLDVVFLPFRTPAGLLVWSALAMAGAQGSNSSLVTARAREVTINAKGPAACLQLDGEAVGDAPSPEGKLSLSIAIEPGVLLVRTGPDY